MWFAAWWLLLAVLLVNILCAIISVTKLRREWKQADHVLHQNLQLQMALEALCVQAVVLRRWPLTHILGDHVRINVQVHDTVRVMKADDI